MRHGSNMHFLVKTNVTVLVYRVSKLPGRNKPISEKNPFYNINVRGSLFPKQNVKQNCFNQSNST